MNRISNVRGRVNTALMIMALLAFSAALVYGMRTAFAWTVPDVSITAPLDGDSVSGSVAVSATYSVSNGNIHSVVLLIDGVSVTTQPIGAQSGSYTFNWDSSTTVNGAHTIAVRAYTAAAPSTHYNENSIFVTVSNGPAPDIDAPVISATLPVDGQVYAVGTVGVNAGLSDNVAVNAGSVVVNMDGSNVNLQLAINASSVSGNLNVSDGNHTLTIDCSDTSGNPASQESISFKVDTTPPSLSITSPADGAVFHTATANISGAVSDAVSGVDSVMVNGSAATVSGGSFSLNGLALNEGANVVTVVAADNAGHANTMTITMTYIAPPPADTTSPVLAVTSPLDGATVDTASVNVTGTVSDAGSGVKSVKVNGAAAAINGNIFSLNNVALAEGANTLTVVAEDNSSNTAQEVVRVTYEKPVVLPPADTVGPTLTVTSPLGGSAVNTASVNFAGAVSDADSGVKSVKVNGMEAVINGNSYSLNNVSLAEGANAITVAAVDNAGNITQEVVNVTYEKPVVLPPADTTAPAITVTNPADGLIVDVATVNVTGTVIDAGSGVKTVKVNGTTATINGNTFSLNNVALVEGANTITVAATDNSDNESREVVGVTYIKPVVVVPPPADTVGPVLAVTSPLDGLTVDTAAVNVTGTVSDTGSGVKSVKVNGAAATINGNSFIINNIALVEGANTITVIASDNSDNTTQEVVNVTYEKPVVVTPPGEVVPPVLTLEVTSPEDELITNNKNATVAGTTSDGAVVTLNGADVATGAGGTISYNAALAEGANTLTVKSCLGDDCMTEARDVTLDTRAPEVGGVAEDGGAVYVSAQDNAGGSGLDHSRAVLMIDGDEAPAVYDLARKAYKLGASGLAGGGHTVTASVYDVAGNAAQVSVNFTVGGSGGGVTVAIEGVPGKIVDLQTAAGAVYGPQPEGSAQVVPQTSASWNLSAPPAKTGAEAFIKELAEKDKERRVKLPPGAFGFVADQPKPPSPPHLDCGDLRKGASAAMPSDAAVVESVDGNIVAAADAPGGVDESSIVVQVDGVAVPHEYDKKTKKLKAHVKGLKKGNHTASVTAADALGNTGVATTAFGVDPIVYSISIDNADKPGTGHIAGGERARVTVTMDENNFSGAWIELMNANGAVPIGDKYYIDAVDPLAATGPFEYATDAYIYTSTDINGATAAAVIAGIPLDASATQFMTSASVLYIDNPPVNANFSGVVFNNLSGGASNSINQGDIYTVDASGSAGMQGVTDVLLNVDTLAGGVQNPWDASVRGDNMFESPQYGAGTYTTAGDGAALDILTDTLGHGARALLPLVCSTFAGNDACRAGGVVYVGQAPVIYDVLFEKAGAPQGEPFTQPGQQYKITIHGDIPPGQLPYLKAVVVNKDRMPQMLLFSGVNPYLTQYITNFVETSAGYYVADGTLNGFTDADGQLAVNAAVAVTTSGFIESALSNTIAINEQQQPPAAVGNITLRNVEHPDWMTIAMGESFRVEADSAPGQALECRVEAAGLSGGGGLTQPMASTPMAETPQGSGHYTCQGPVSSRPDVNGAPADFLMAKIYSGGNFAEISDDLLPYRWGINEVHFRNISRAGAADIAPGERFEITASGDSGKTQLAVMLLDAAVNHSHSQNGPVSLDFSGAVDENPAGSGQYRVEGTFPSVPAGTNFVRAFVITADSAQNLTNLAPSTEILGVATAPPEAPTAITHIDNAPVENGVATSTSLSPVVAGTAPSNSMVNIYELIPGGSSGDMTPVAGGAAMSAEFVPGVGTYGDNFDNGNYTDNWHLSYISGPSQVNERDGRLMMDLGLNSSAVLDGARDYNGYTNHAAIAIDVTYPSSQNPAPGDFNGYFSLALALTSGQQYLRYALDWNYFPQNGGGGSGLTLRLDNGGIICSAPYSPLSVDTTYRMELAYMGGQAPGLEARINGATILNCPVAQLDNGSLRTGIFAGNNSISPIHIEMDNMDTGVPVPGGYNISAPALSHNGADYSFQNMGALLIDPHGGPPTWLPAQEFSGIDGKKDIHAFAVTLHDFRPDPANNPGTYYSEGKITIYSGGAPENPAQDQLDVLTAFMNQLKQMGVMSYYTIDASGVAFAARGAGAPYQPVSPISTQITICREEAGAPGYLNWDAASGKYLASYTPLIYQGAEYKDAVIWGLVQSGGDGPNLVASPNMPIWWATGSEDVSAGVATFVDNGTTVMITGYATAGFFALLPSFGVTIYSQADHVLIAPVAAGQPYTWNQSALEAAGLTPSGQTVCSGYGRRLIASVSAAGAGTFSTQTVPFDTYGEKLLQAESVDAVTGVVKSASGIVTYHLNAATVTVDVTPPQITFTSPVDGTLSASPRPAVSAAVTDAGAGVDWNNLTCETSSQTPCSAAYMGGDAVAVTFGADLPDGANTITIRAADLASPANSAAATLMINIDATPPVISGLSATPTPFSPNNATSDGVKDTVAISANVSDAHLDGWQIFIQNASGTLKTFSGAGTTVSATWDGKSDTNAVQPDGTYKIIIAALDALQNYSEATASVISDNTNPAVSVVNPLAGDTIAPAAYTFHIAAADANGVTRVEVKLDGGATATAVLVGSDWQYTFNFTGQSNTNHTVVAKAFDNAGNNTVTQSVAFKVGVGNISVVSAALANLTWPGDTRIGPGDRFRVTIKMSNAVGTPEWKLLNADRFTWPSGQQGIAGMDVAFTDCSLTSNGTTRNYDCALATSTDVSGIAAGRVRVLASTDGFNTGVISNILTMRSATLPAPVIATPKDGSNASTTTLTIHGLSEPGTIVQIWLVHMDGDKLIGTGPQTSANGIFDVPVVLPEPAGLKTLYAVAIQPITNITSAHSIPITLNLWDTTPPVIRDAAAVPNPFSPGVSIGSKDTTAITANVYDETPVNWEIRILDAGGGLILKYPEDFNLPIDQFGPNPLSFVWDGAKPPKNKQAAQPQPEGVYTYEIIAKDSRNQKSLPATGTVTIDKTAPTIAITSPANNAVLGGIQQIVLINATDTLSMDKVEIYVNNVLHTTAAPAGNGRWNGVLALKLIGDGPRTLSAVAIDKAGNRATSSINIIVDAVAPNPPTDVVAISDESGAETLFWQPPTTNEDGSPLTDLAGYNVYVATQTGGCEPVISAAPSIAIACSNDATQGAYTITGPALVYNGVTYNQSPLGGTGALWLNAAAGASLSAALSTLPLANSSLVQPGKPVFAYTITLSATQRSGTAGIYNITVYTQSSQQEVEAWMSAAEREGYVLASMNVVSSISPACVTGGSTGSFSAEVFPLNSVRQITYQKFNGALLTVPEFSLSAADGHSGFVVKAVDTAGNLSRMSNAAFFTGN